MDTYSHVLPSMQQEAMRKLDDLFQEKGPNEYGEKKEIGGGE
jgi:hypothetical protein